MGGSLSDAASIADEVGYEYEGTSVCTIGGPLAFITNSLQYIVSAESAYQYLYNTTFDDIEAGSSYVTAIVEHVEHESYDPVPLNKPHATHAGFGGLRTAMIDSTLFENEAAVSQDRGQLQFIMPMRRSQQIL